MSGHPACGHTLLYATQSCTIEVKDPLPKIAVPCPIIVYLHKGHLLLSCHPLLQAHTLLQLPPVAAGNDKIDFEEFARGVRNIQLLNDCYNLITSKDGVNSETPSVRYLSSLHSFLPVPPV